MKDPRTAEERWRFLFRTCDADAFAQMAWTALQDHPDDVLAEIQYAEALGMTGQLQAKLPRLRQLVERHPQSSEAHLALGLELLREGQYREGWPHFDARKNLNMTGPPDDQLPNDRHWSFQPLKGNRLLLVREQGLGDTLQFIRYGHSLNSQGIKVCANVQTPLRRLLKGSPAVGTILDQKEPTQIAYWINLMDLVPYLNPTIEDVSPLGPYVAPPAGRMPLEFPRHRPGRLRVGLAWSGSDGFASNALRSIPVPDLSALRDVSHCSFFSLMPPDRRNDIASAGAEDWITDLSSITTPFEMLARAISAMDIVLTVCTSVAHLAAAMGKPTLILLSQNPDWRWGRERRDTPWYPSVTLLRQQKLGQWREPVSAARDVLDAL